MTYLRTVGEAIWSIILLVLLVVLLGAPLVLLVLELLKLFGVLDS